MCCVHLHAETSDINLVATELLLPKALYAKINPFIPGLLKWTLPFLNVDLSIDKIGVSV